MNGCTAKTGRRQLHTHAYLPVAPNVWGGQLQETEGSFLQPSPIADRLSPSVKAFTSMQYWGSP